MTDDRFKTDLWIPPEWEAQLPRMAKELSSAIDADILARYDAEAWMVALEDAALERARKEAPS